MTNLRIFRWLMLVLAVPAPVLAGIWTSSSSSTGQPHRTGQVRLVGLAAEDDIGGQHDQEAMRSIKLALLNDPIMEEDRISVSVTQGRAYFTGTVHSAVEQARAEEIARQTPGVLQVVDNLAVDPPKTWRMDLTIREAIESTLSRSLFVDGQRIQVHVEDGVAVLTGFVESLQERRAARQDAYNSGANLVVNRLKIAAMEATNDPEL